MESKNALKSGLFFFHRVWNPLRKRILWRLGLRPKSPPQNIFLVGVGGGGSNTLDDFSTQVPHARSVVLTHKPISTLSPVEIISAETDVEAVFRKNFSGSAHYVLCVGLGGNFSSSHILKVVEWMTKNQKDFTVAASLPFRFEGIKRKDQAMDVHHRWKNEKFYFFLPLDTILDSHRHEKMGVALAIFHQKLWEVIENELPRAT
jgi:cell division GTPase FtsZ